MQDFRLAPDEYDAIHFHDDDITDADWPAALTLTVPETMASGVYAFGSPSTAWITTFRSSLAPPSRGVATLPSCSPPAPTWRTQTIASPLRPTAWRCSLGHTPVVHAEDLVLQNNPEFGRSCYEAHNDGSGVVLKLLPADH